MRGGVGVEAGCHSAGVQTGRLKQQTFIYWLSDAD